MRSSVPTKPNTGWPAMRSTGTSSACARRPRPSRSGWQHRPTTPSHLRNARLGARPVYRKAMRRRRRGFRSSVGCSGCAAYWRGLKSTAIACRCAWSTAVNISPRPGTTSTLPGSLWCSGKISGSVRAIGSPPTVPARSRLAILTITVTPDGEVSLRLPKPLEHLANANHGRYILSSTAQFRYRRDEWLARISGGQSVSYTITRTPGGPAAT